MYIFFIYYVCVYICEWVSSCLYVEVRDELAKVISSPTAALEVRLTIHGLMVGALPFELSHTELLFTVFRDMTF